MKVKFTQPLNVNGTNYRMGDEAQLSPQDAKSLVRAGYATIVVERAVVAPRDMEIRDAR